MNDSDLLRRYSCVGAEEAFAGLVGRYGGLVYSAALRQTGRPQDAEDIAQVVFTLLARKAAGLPRDVILAGWLLRTTRFVVLNARRRESNRLRTEMEAMSLHQTETEAAWERMCPVLDEALMGLGEKDRNAVVLRFFEHKSFKDIAREMGTSEDGAQKRVSRALERLRAMLAQRGVVVPAVLVGTAITSKAVEALPSQLAASLTSKAISGTIPAGSLQESTKAGLSGEAGTRGRRLALSSGATALLILLMMLGMREFLSKGSRTNLAVSHPASPLGAGIRMPGLALAANPGQPGLGKLLLRVLDSQSGGPVANARIRSLWVTGFGTNFRNVVTNSLLTDREGAALVPFDTNVVGLWSCWIEIQKDGYQPKFINWGAVRGDAIEDLPAEYTTRIETGHVIAGSIVNENGEGISDALVDIREAHPFSGAPGLIEYEARREGLALAHSEATDSQGRWMCNHVPAQLDEVTYTVSHPEYVAATFRSAKIGATSSPGLNRLSEDDFRAQAAVMTLKPGLVITGSITDEKGEPIKGAEVIENRVPNDHASRQIAGADGCFRFGDVPPEELILTAQATDFDSAEKTIHPTNQLQEIRFSLVRTAGLPGRALSQQVAKSAQPTTTAVTGKVFDARTGRPIDLFEVWASTTLRRETSSMVLSKELKTTGKDGQFRFLALWDSIERFDIEIKADGYLPGGGPVNASLTNQAALVLRLEPFATLTGVVLTPEGRPADRAQLVLCDSSRGAAETQVAYMYNRAQLELWFSRGYSAVTDGDGRFRLEPKTLSALLIAVHKSGYAEVKLDELSRPGTVRLRPWGRVFGRLRSASQPGVGRTITLENGFGEQPSLWIHLTATSDVQGHFVIEDVPPGEWTLSPYNVRIRVEPGKTTEIVVGGEGRKVVGKFRFKNSQSPFAWQNCTLSLTSQLPGPPVPEREAFASDLEFESAQRDWWTWKSEFLRSTAGQAALRNSRHYSCRLAPDGDFSLEEVMPGAYQLALFADPWHYDNKILIRLTEISRRIIMPEISAGGDTLDLGELQLNNP